MAKLLRFLCITLAAVLVTVGGATATVVVVNGFATHAESATADPLKALSSVIQQPSIVYADDGIPIGEFRGPNWQVPVKLAQVPTIVIAAVLDTEDARFYQHGGYDIPSIVRALGSDSSGNSLQGGSTITQQVVKNLYLTSQRTLTRKFKEAVIASRLQKEYTKNDILQTYLNTVYLGEGSYGVQAAAKVYFNQDIGQSSLAEAALFAGMIHDPNGDDPIQHPVAARARRAFVLSRMVYYGTITQAQADAANKVPLPTTITKPAEAPDQVIGNYVQQVENYLLGSSSPLGATYDERYQALFEGGLKIYTNLDPSTQNDAEAALVKDIYPVGAAHAVNGSPVTGALVAIQPSTGDVKALVGGAGGAAKFDLATQAYRQPGSGFKLFSLVAAYEQGLGPNDFVDGTAPCAVGFTGPYGNGYLPPNPPANNASDGNEGGMMTIDKATADSVNCAFLRIAQKVGLDNVLSAAQSLGVHTATSKSNPNGDFTPYPSDVIGGQGVTVLDMANAYATVANGGTYRTPQFVNHIVDNTGATIFTERPAGKQIIPTQVDEEILNDLEQVVLAGTGTGARLNGRQAAGKTGTTDKSVDAWFNGITPQLAASVWMGNPAGDSSGFGMLWGPGGQVFGGDYPASAWADFMNAALAGQPALTFPQPNPALIPKATVIQSPGTGGASRYGYNPYNGFPNYPTTVAPPATAPPPASTTAPTTTAPVRKPTAPPTTAKARTPPTTHKHG